MVKYFLRAPVFPLLVETDERVFGVTSSAEFDRIVARGVFSGGESYCVVDSQGEGWAYVPNVHALSPLTVKKRWNKREMIAFYNESLRTDEAPYVGGSLSNKKVQQLVQEITRWDQGI